MQTFEESTMFRTNGIDLPTSVAGLGSVARGDFYNLDSLLNRLVLDKRVQLIKRPIGKKSIHSFTSILVSDSFKDFHSDCVSFVKGFNNSFAYAMVCVSHKPSLSARKSFQMSLGRFCAFGLERTSKSLKSIEFIINSLEELLFRCYSYIVYTEVDTNNFSVTTEIVADINFFGNNDVQEHLILSNEEIGTSDFKVFIFIKVFRDYNRNLDSSFNGRQTNNIILQRETPMVISHCHVFFDSGFSLVIFENCTSNISTTNYKLGGELSMFSDRIITQIMEFSLIRSMQIITIVNDFLSRNRILSHGFKKDFIKRYFNFNSGNGFHTYLIGKQIFKCLPQFLHPMNKVVSLRSVL